MPLMRKGSFSAKTPENAGQERFARVPSDPDRPFRINTRGRASGELPRTPPEFARDTNGPKIVEPNTRAGRHSLDLERPALFGSLTNFGRTSSSDKPLPRTRSGSAGRASTESKCSANQPQDQAFRINTHGRKSEEILTRCTSDSAERPFRINTHGRASGELQRPSIELPDRAACPAVHGTPGDCEGDASKNKAARGGLRGWFLSLHRMLRHKKCHTAPYVTSAC